MSPQHRDWRVRAIAAGEHRRWDAEALARASDRAARTGPEVCPVAVTLDPEVDGAIRELARAGVASEAAAEVGGVTVDALLAAHCEVALLRLVGLVRAGPDPDREIEYPLPTMEMLLARLVPDRRGQLASLTVGLDEAVVGAVDAMFAGLLDGVEDGPLLLEVRRDDLRAVAIEGGLRSRLMVTGHIPQRRPRRMPPGPGASPPRRPG